MAVVTTKSTRGAVKVLSSTNATLATAITEVINELDNLNMSGNKVSFNTIHNGTNYVVLAYILTGSGGAPY